MFDAIGKPIVLQILQGFNAALIAYGQTGSGKTYSMMGPGFDGAAGAVEEAVMQDPGLIPRIMEKLFEEVSRYDLPRIDE